VYVYEGDGTGNENTILWSYVTGGEIQCTPSLVDLNGDSKLEVIVSSDDMNVYALNGATGLPYWIQPAPNPDATNFLMHGTPAIAQFNDGAFDAVIGCGNGYLIALNGEDGSTIWEYKAGGGIVGTPGVSDVNGDSIPDVCVGAYDTFIHMVNGANGKKLWTYYVGPGLYNIQNSPIMVDLNGDNINDVVIGAKLTGDFPGRLFALDGPTGNEIWAPVQVYGNACRTPAPVKINDDDVWDFILTTYFTGVYSFYGIDGLTGQIIYNRLTPNINPSAKFNYSSVISGDFTGDGHMNAMFSYTDANADPDNQTGFIDLVNVADEGLPGEWGGKSLFQMQISAGKKAEITAPPAVGDVDNDGELELIACTMRGRTHVLDLHAPVPTDPEQIPWPQHMGSRWHNGIPCFIPPS
ncbi:MAG: PQQ-binding-like beta-propeller repeat protein, partial [bacterium]